MLATNLLGLNEKEQFNYFYHDHRKHVLTAYCLLFSLGMLGGHHFYLNQRRGWLYLLFCWSLVPGLFVIIDLVRLPWQVQRYNSQLTIVLHQLLHKHEAEPNKLTLIAVELAKLELAAYEKIAAGVILLGLILPLIAYVSLRWHGQHLELHWIKDHLDGSHSDDYLRI